MLSLLPKGGQHFRHPSPSTLMPTFLACSWSSVLVMLHRSVLFLIGSSLRGSTNKGTSAGIGAAAMIEEQREENDNHCYQVPHYWVLTLSNSNQDMTEQKRFSAERKLSMTIPLLPERCKLLLLLLLVLLLLFCFLFCFCFCFVVISFAT